METIDLIPEGAKTPEGAARINKAARAVEDAKGWCAEGWTGSELLATPKYQAWRRLHTES